MTPWALLNLEVKARDPDPAATAGACWQLSALERETFRQRDTYFDVSSGRLKVREELDGGTAELVYYTRPATDGVRPSRYWRVGVASEVRDVLGMALGIAGVVEKTRRVFLFRHVRIHLDEVVGLGSFVELEAVLPEHAELPAEDEALTQAMTALGLRERELIAEGYLELVSRS